MRINYQKDDSFNVENEKDLQNDLQDLLERNKVISTLFLYEITGSKLTATCDLID